jgi:2-amino-4-hydroxy-6-hydroxymethyldihydropteridine diphosphokinase
VVSAIRIDHSEGGMMALLTLSIGSNQDARFHIGQALDGLHKAFGALRVSSVYESEAVGFSGGNFLNMVVAAETELPLDAVSETIKKLEDANGRDRSQARFSSRTLDIDILTFGNLQGQLAGIRLPRPEITENAYVLWPLSEICAELRHPATGMTYRELWRCYDKQRQRLWPIDFEWQGRQISSPSASPPGKCSQD